MRTKDNILSDARRDITNQNYRDLAPFWLSVRQIEVLIDIRDILNDSLKTAMALQLSVKNDI